MTPPRPPRQTRPRAASEARSGCRPDGLPRVGIGRQALGHRRRLSAADGNAARHRPDSKRQAAQRARRSSRGIRRPFSARRYARRDVDRPATQRGRHAAGLVLVRAFRGVGLVHNGRRVSVDLAVLRHVTTRRRARCWRRRRRQPRGPFGPRRARETIRRTVRVRRFCNRAVPDRFRGRVPFRARVHRSRPGGVHQHRPFDRSDAQREPEDRAQPVRQLPRLLAEDGRLHDRAPPVAPNFLQFLPALLALGWSVGGDTGLLLVPALLGALALLALYALASTIVGPRWALLGPALLVLAPLQSWFSRDAYTDAARVLSATRRIWLLIETRHGGHSIAATSPV